VRPQTDADREFLCALYASTRRAELAQVDWPDDVKRAFLTSQFDAQCAHYAKAYRDASFEIVEREGAPIGRLYVYWNDPKDVRIVDIALVPEACGQGIGGELIRGVQERAAAIDKSVSIHVEQFNPALRLYRRLGFEHVSEFGVYYLMRWQPTSRQSLSPTATTR
jgi:ribosomal protein S18 acetylase RimI-like enzyme